MLAESALDFRLSAKTSFPFIQADRRVSGPAFPALPSFRIQVLPSLEQGHEDSDLVRGKQPGVKVGWQLRWGIILPNPLRRRLTFRASGQAQPGLQGQVFFFQCPVLGEQGLMLSKQRFEIHHGALWR